MPDVLYAGMQDDDKILSFAIDAASGKLVSSGCRPEEPEHRPRIGVRLPTLLSAERLNEETVMIDMHAHWRALR